MSNAARHKKRAAEFELQKQFDKAVASYARAIEAADADGEEIDVALFNKVGDLNLRLGRVPDAVASYERAVEHYASHALYNNAIALCNKILRHAPGRAGIYLQLGRICGRKGMRGDATRNLLEYAKRMREEGRTEEAMRSLGEVAALMPELEEIRRLVLEHAERVGISLPLAPAPGPSLPGGGSGLVFLDIDYDAPADSPPAGAPSDRAPSPRPVDRPSPIGELLLAEAAAAPAPQPPSPPVQRPGASPPERARADEAVASSAIPGAESPSVLGRALPPEPASEELLPFLDVGATGVDVGVRDTGLLPFLDIDDESPGLAAPDSVPLPFLDVAPQLPDAVEQLPEMQPFVDHGVFDAHPGADALASPEVASARTERVDPSEPADQRSDSGQPPAVGAEPEVAGQELPDDVLAGIVPLRGVPIDGAGVRRAPPPPARPVVRLHPHDFILPGELPPIRFPESMLPTPADDDGIVAVGDAADVDERAPATSPLAPPPVDPEVPAAESAPVEDPLPVEDPVLVEDPEPVEDPVLVEDPEPVEDPVLVEDPELVEDPVVDRAAPIDDVLEGAFVRAFSGAYDAVSGAIGADEPERARAALPESPVASLAIERCRRLRDEVEAHPGDWARRRRLAEALFEAGERELGLEELAGTALGLQAEGALGDALRIVEELLRIAPDEIVYHQKRVELAVRLGDRDRLRDSYLDLADSLVRVGHPSRAEPVYVRVLELDPWDDRARSALGAAAPPPPAPAPSARGASDDYVSLSEWLADESAPRDTRMRMTAPVVTGDEAADFDRLLQHFREGVARSLGEEDFDTHYDLGVAYKEMGLLEDAIAEFQRALRSPARRLPAYEALGQCFIEQGSFPVAVTVLSRALHEPGLDDVQRVGVLFLLGYACEALQRRDEARTYYHRVYATDSSFRDVAVRLAALERGAA